MSSSIDKKTYLQKYLGGPSKEKKKKKKKAVKGKGFKIIDDDLDLTKLRPLDGDELDVFDEGEDAPQIAGIIDERPEDVRKAEQFQSSSKWKVVNQDDGFNSKLQIQEIKRDIKEKEKENELIFGKMYSDSEDEQKNDSDLSPPRKSDSKNKDPSPPRRERNKSPNHERRKETKYDSDASPPRKREKSPKRRERSPINQRGNESDQSPPRKRGKSPIERRKESKHYSNPSPPRKREQSPRNEVKRVRKSRWGNDESQSEQRASNGITSSRNNISNSPKLYQRNRSSDSDLSPPRKKDRNRISPDRNKRKHSDSDPSPPRRDREKSRSNVTDKSKNTERHNKQRRYSSDLSPPRRKRDNSAENSRNRVRNMSPKRDRNNRQSDSDQSPPRRNTERDRDTQNRTNERDKYNDSPPPSNKKMARTLEGKMAGLQNARQLREENDQFRQKEDEVFKKLADDVSGRNAKAVSRKGKRETSEERNKKKEKSERQKELDEKYKKWSRGVKQVEAQESRMQDYLHEASKPLARLRDDKDLESSLKQIDREGDPMLKYIKDKKRERGELGPEKPSYKGSFPPNRFNIRPGYRWDGVDRSNGYEKKFFEQQSKRKAQEEEAYKWSTEDL